MPARKAAEIVQQAGIGEGNTILADFAMAGLVKSYAGWIETRHPNGTRNEVRGGRIASEIWRRIIEEGKVAEALGGSVRLEGSPQSGGAPAVAVVDIQFDDSSLGKMIGRHLAAGLGSLAPAAAPIAKAVPKATAAVTPAAPVTTDLPNAGPSVCPADKDACTPIEQPRSAKPREKVGIPAGAVTVTVAQAMAALGLGRTTIDKMMKAGVLTRVKIGSRTLITVDSILAVIAGKGSSQTA